MTGGLSFLTGLITFLAVTFFCLTTFGAVVTRTCLVRCFVTGAGSTLGAMVVHPATAKDRNVAINACFNALPTTASLLIRTDPDADWLAPKRLWPS